MAQREKQVTTRDVSTRWALERSYVESASYIDVATYIALGHLFVDETKDIACHAEWPHLRRTSLGVEEDFLLSVVAYAKRLV